MNPLNSSFVKYSFKGDLKEQREISFHSFASSSDRQVHRPGTLTAKTGITFLDFAISRKKSIWGSHKEGGGAQRVKSSEQGPFEL